MGDVLIKLGLAVVLGGAIGLEREYGRKPAGLRTNILICLGSTMMMALSDVLLAGRQGTADALRVAAGVITGMGFIGAGTIMRAGGHVHGLTTASTLWAVTGLGLVIGSGRYALAAAFTAVVILTLIVFRRVEDSLPQKTFFRFILRVRDMEGFLSELRKIERASRVRFEDISVKRGPDTVRATFGTHATLACEKELSARLTKLGEILEIHAE